jgi:hypothetical protein
VTTICWDGKHLYADSQVTGDNMKSLMTKARRVSSPDGPVFVAVAGEVHVLNAVIGAIKAGEPIEPHISGNSSVLVVKGGECRVVSGKKSWPETAPVFIGSGSSVARGAYHVSKSAAKALAAACAIDLYSGGPITKLRTS